jgi:hypothetical protein
MIDSKARQLCTIWIFPMSNSAPNAPFTAPGFRFVLTVRLGWPKAAPTSLTGSYLRCGRHIRQARSRGPQGATGLPRNPNSLAWLACHFAAFQLDRRLHAHWHQSWKQPVSKFIAGLRTCRLCCTCMVEAVLSILDKACRLYGVVGIATHHYGALSVTLPDRPG